LKKHYSQLEIMAKQLSDADFITTSYYDPESWVAYYWIYIFAAMIGFATTIAEPSLIAVAIKANQASGGTISMWGLRIVVAIGVAIALRWALFALLLELLCIFISSSGILLS
jgi:hypothetical protein